MYKLCTILTYRICLLIIQCRQTKLFIFHPILDNCNLCTCSPWKTLGWRSLGKYADYLVHKHRMKVRRWSTGGCSLSSPASSWGRRGWRRGRRSGWGCGSATAPAGSARGTPSAGTVCCGACLWRRPPMVSGCWTEGGLPPAAREDLQLNYYTVNTIPKS